MQVIRNGDFGNRVLLWGQGGVWGWGGPRKYIIGNKERERERECN